MGPSQAQGHREQAIPPGQAANRVQPSPASAQLAKVKLLLYGLLPMVHSGINDAAHCTAGEVRGN
jgi:hypothetical protein